MNATKPARDPQYLYSRATLPDGRTVVLTWDRGDCIKADVGGAPVDLAAALGGAEAREAWLGERTEDEGIDP